MVFLLASRTDELPIVNLKVFGVDYSFLFITRVLHVHLFLLNFMKGRSRIVLCALLGFLGTDIICHMTPAIEVRVPNHLPLFHRFVITPNLPLNLLGIDLMHKLSFEIVFSDSSVNFSLLSDVLDATVDVMPYS